MRQLYKNATRVLIFTVLDSQTLDPIDVTGHTGKVYVDGTENAVSPHVDQVNHKGEFHFSASKTNTTGSVGSRAIKFRHISPTTDDILVDLEIQVVDSPIPAS